MFGLRRPARFCSWNVKEWRSRLRLRETASSPFFAKMGDMLREQRKAKAQGFAVCAM